MTKVFHNICDWVLENQPCWYKGKFWENAIEVFDQFFTCKFYCTFG